MVDHCCSFQAVVASNIEAVYKLLRSLASFREVEIRTDCMASNSGIAGNCIANESVRKTLQVIGHGIGVR